VRVRITRTMPGQVDGVALDRFVPGCTYEVDASLATYMVVLGCATPAEHGDGPVEVLPVEEVSFGVNVTEPPAIAADKGNAPGATDGQRPATRRSKD
jgi:hypothetical protein